MVFKVERAYYQFAFAVFYFAADESGEEGLAPRASGKRVAGGENRNKAVAGKGRADERGYHIGLFVIPEGEIVLFKVADERVRRVSGNEVKRSHSAVFHPERNIAYPVFACGK